MEQWEQKLSFLEDPNLTTVTEGVYIYKNFIDKETVAKYNAILNEKWEKRQTDFVTMIDWYDEKVLTNVVEMYPIWEKMSQFLYPTHVIHPRLEVTVIKPGDGGMFVHADSPGEGHEDELSQYDVWSTCTLLDYGIIVYFGEYTGGAVFYPELGLEVQPEPGDLVIHGALSRHKHGVREVDSGIRYAFANFCLPATKNPGTFYNFNTDQFNQIKSDPDFIKKYSIPMNTRQLYNQPHSIRTDKE